MMPNNLNVPCTLHLEAATVPVETNPDGTPIETLPPETNPDGTPIETTTTSSIEETETTAEIAPTTTLPEPESIEGPSGPESGQDGPWNESGT